MALEPVDPEIERLLTVAVESVERLDILLTIRRGRPATFTAKMLSKTMGIARAAVDTHLAILCGRGFLGVTIGSDLLYTYAPLSPKIDQLVTSAAGLWETRRVDVLALLKTEASPSPAIAFADAFRVRKGKGDADG